LAAVSPRNHGLEFGLFRLFKALGLDRAAGKPVSLLVDGRSFVSDSPWMAFARAALVRVMVEPYIETSMLVHSQLRPSPLALFRQVLQEICATTVQLRSTPGPANDDGEEWCRRAESNYRSLKTRKLLILRHAKNDKSCS
jgi:hypothetical protein